MAPSAHSSLLFQHLPPPALTLSSPSSCTLHPKPDVLLGRDSLTPLEHLGPTLWQGGNVGWRTLNPKGIPLASTTSDSYRLDTNLVLRLLGLAAKKSKTTVKAGPHDASLKEERPRLRRCDHSQHRDETIKPVTKGSAERSRRICSYARSSRGTAAPEREDDGQGRG